MKTTVFSIVFFFISTAIAVPVFKPAKGSNEAAVKVASDWLQGYFNAPSDFVFAPTVLSSSDKAVIVQMTIHNNVCTLKLQKDANANQFGWLVSSNTCSQILQYDQHK